MNLLYNKFIMVILLFVALFPLTVRGSNQDRPINFYHPICGDRLWDWPNFLLNYCRGLFSCCKAVGEWLITVAGLRMSGGICALPVHDVMLHVWQLIGKVNGVRAYYRANVTWWSFHRGRSERNSNSLASPLSFLFEFQVCFNNRSNQCKCVFVCAWVYVIHNIIRMEFLVFIGSQWQGNSARFSSMFLGRQKYCNF